MSNMFKKNMLYIDVYLFIIVFKNVNYSENRVYGV